MVHMSEGESCRKAFLAYWRSGVILGTLDTPVDIGVLAEKEVIQ
jgi:hypothetical protein